MAPTPAGPSFARALLVAGLIVGVAVTGMAQQVPASGVITGRVVDEGTNAPIADARISLFSMARLADGQVPQPRQATSARDGTFRFEGLEPGAYRLNVQKTGYVTPRTVTPSPPLVIEAEGPPAATVVVLQRGGVIAGRVLAPGGEPVAKASVLALQRPPRDPSGPLQMAAPFESTNDLGEFRIHGLAAGDYYIQALRAEYSNAPRMTVLARTFFPATAEPSAAQPVKIGAGASIGGIDITLLEVPAYAIRGVVVDEVGNPVANAGVQLSGDRSRGPSSVGLSRTRSGADGSFAIEGVQSGSYRLNAAWPNVPRAAATGADGFASGPGGVIVITETRNGITTELRFEPVDEVGIELQNDHVSGVRLVAKRPAR
jgi:hypothetical protein